MLVEKYKILKQMLKNEKRVNEKLNEILAEKSTEAKNLINVVWLFCLTRIISCNRHSIQ